MLLYSIEPRDDGGLRRPLLNAEQVCVLGRTAPVFAVARRNNLLFDPSDVLDMEERDWTVLLSAEACDTMVASRISRSAASGIGYSSA